MRLKLGLGMSAGVLALSMAMTAQAQDTPPASGQADTPAQTDGANASVLGDIVVTARRREESLQDVPVAISAVSGEALEQKGVRSVEDLRGAVPGLNISGQRRDEASFYLRGQGPGLFVTGQRNFSSVATYFAEVPVDIAGPGMFFDLASVQVLKGPQGTLFGRNTTGGAVLFEPQRPTDAIEGYVKAGFGNHDYRELEGVMNIASENGVIAVRLAGNIAHRDGYTTSVVSGQKLDERDYKAYRLSVLLKPFDGFENLTIVDGRDKDQNGTSALLRQINPASPLAPALAPLLARQQALGARQTLIASPIFDRQYSFGVTNKTSWEVADDITLKNIVSFRRVRTNRASDYDGTAIPTFAIENAQLPREWSFGQDSWTEEFQVQGKLRSIGLDYILGYYHEQSKPGFPQEIRQSQFGSVAVRALDNDDKSDALFAHGEVKLTDALQLSGGFRYTWDKRKGSISVRNVAGTCVQRVPAGTGPFVCPFTASARFDAPSYDATLQYKVADRTLLYGAYRHGYKSGALNLPSPDDRFTVVQPETVDEFEVGLKADWDIGVPLRTNIAAFLDKYKDIQISQPVLVPGVGVVSLVRNAAKATNKGIEFEGTIVPVEGLSLGGFVSYLDAHSDTTVAGTSAIDGRQTAFQPKWKYGFNGRFDIPVADSVGKLSLSADYSWQSKVNTNETNPALITTYPSYGVLNARIELGDIAGSGIDLALFGTNLTNKTYILGGFALASALGFESAFYGEPRMYGASLKLRF